MSMMNQIEILKLRKKPTGVSDSIDGMSNGWGGGGIDFGIPRVREQMISCPKESLSLLQSLNNGAQKIISETGIFILEYPLPDIVVASTDEEFNSYHSTGHAPDWSNGFENDVGTVIIRRKFLEFSEDLRKKRIQGLTHEIFHGIHNKVFFKIFNNVTADEIRKFKAEFIKGKRHLGFLEGLMEVLSKGEPDWDSVFNIMRTEGLQDLSLLRVKMPGLDEAPKDNNQSYTSAHVQIFGFAKYFDQNKKSILENMRKNGIEMIFDELKTDGELHPSSYQYNPNDYEKTSGGAILFRLIVEYMTRMFKMFRNGEKTAIDFEDFFEKMTGQKFNEVHTFSLNIIKSKALERDFRKDQVKIIKH